MISRVFIANRGEIAVRVIATCKRLGIETVLGVSEADIGSLGARLADRTVVIGPARPGESYLNERAIVAAATATLCDAIHPGYGFLSEGRKLAELAAGAGLVFIGPNVEALERAGNKLTTRSIAQQIGIPTSTGSEALEDREQAVLIARSIGFPVLLKAAAGGGGRGMTVCRSEGEVRLGFDRASAEAEAAFGDGRLFAERYVERARHVEVQIVADQHGNVLHLGDRDCSVQRRHQKLVEEAPASSIDSGLRQNMWDDAVRLIAKMEYDSIGTVEFLVDLDRGDYILLEINARIQVEHPVTEMITGLDLVELQILAASGYKLPLTQEDVELQGHAIECRINAEDPQRDFAPSPGLIKEWIPPVGPGIRVDTHCFSGYRFPPYYDSLMGKVIVHERNRTRAVLAMEQALGSLTVTGTASTAQVQKNIIVCEEFVENNHTTSWLEQGGLATVLDSEGNTYVRN